MRARILNRLRTRSARLLAKASLAGAVAVSAMTMASCGVDDVRTPDLIGPSERAESLVMTASPDILVSDGVSFSIIRATFRDQNAQPLRGRAIYFAIADNNGRFAAIGRLSSDKGNVLTDQNGVATIIYTSPYRTDATANQTVQILARPIGDDTSGETVSGNDSVPVNLFRRVRIQLVSAEPRLFPSNPNNSAPTCNFAVETPNGARTGVAILFQNTSFDSDGTIVRYEWKFDDTLNIEYSPDTAHIYKSTGTHNVTLTITDNDGKQSACFVNLVIS
jgi:PKD repeat protein